MSQYIFTLADTKAVALAAFNANFTEVYTTLGTLGTAITDEATARANADIALTASIAAKPSLGETSSTAYRGDRGKTAYDFSQTATTVGAALLGLANPSAIRFIRIDANNGVSVLDAATYRTAIGAGTSSFDPLAATTIAAATGDLILQSSLGIAKINVQASGFDIGLAGGISFGAGAAGYAALLSGGFSLDFVFNNLAQRLYANGNVDFAGNLLLRKGTSDVSLTLGAASGTAGGGVLVLNTISSSPAPISGQAQFFSLSGLPCAMDQAGNVIQLATPTQTVVNDNSGVTGRTSTVSVMNDGTSNQLTSLTFTDGVITGFTANL